MSKLEPHQEVWTKPMKTMKALLRELLYKKKEPKDEKPAEESAESENKPELLTQKQEKDETESDEDPGNSELDNSAHRETGGESQESGEGEATMNLPSGEKSSKNWEKKIREAYEKGLRDGRNMEIEEKYFPKMDDGIPHFHGNPSNTNLSGDIFSMAREA